MAYLSPSTHALSRDICRAETSKVVQSLFAPSFSTALHQQQIDGEGWAETGS